MTIRIFSPIARTGLRDRKADTIVRELAAVDARISRREAQRDAITSELSELKSIRAALSDCLSTLTIEASVTEEFHLDFHPDELAIDFPEAAE